MAGNKNSGTSRSTSGTNTSAESQGVQGPQTTATNDTGEVKENTITDAEYTGLSGAESVDAEQGGKDGSTYTVKDGDSLDSIAEETGVDREELMRLNPEIESFTNHVYTGQEIRLK